MVKGIETFVGGQLPRQWRVVLVINIARLDSMVNGKLLKMLFSIEKKRFLFYFKSLLYTHFSSCHFMHPTPKNVLARTECIAGVISRIAM